MMKIKKILKKINYQLKNIMNYNKKINLEQNNNKYWNQK